MNLKLRKLTVEDERKYGIVPGGRPTNTVATRMFSRMLTEGRTIEVSIHICLNAEKRQWTWKNYKFLAVENNTNNCILREIKVKDLTETQKEEFKRKLLNNEDIDFNDFKGEEYLSDELTKDFSTGELLYMHQCYCAYIKISD